jgi:hypothetical protein
MQKIISTLLCLLGVIFVIGCASKIPHRIASDYGKRGIRLIAVMPVINKSSDPKSAEILRDKLLEEIYFKGYPKIPLKVVDDNLANVEPGKRENVSPREIAEMLKVDAVLVSTLTKSGIGSGSFYASTAIEAQFVLLSAKTGESLWNAEHRVAYTNYGFSRKMVELKSSQVYEPAIQEVVNKALETLPDGPDIVTN